MTSEVGKAFTAADLIQHIIGAGNEMAGFILGMDRDQFLKDRRTQRAVTSCISDAGEATTSLMKWHGEFVASHPEIPWASIRRMRNVITHGYHQIDYNVVWRTATEAFPAAMENLPALLAKLQAAVDEEGVG
jgi:uncharacterized protein with HEPN domain